MPIEDLIHILPLISTALWAFVAIGAFGRYGATSPFVRALLLFCLLVSAGCFADWYFLTLVNSSDSLAVVVAASIRTTLLTVASLVILLASKWISRGHSRYDGLLVLPVLGAIALTWDGMITSITAASWGPQVTRDSLRFGLFAIQEIAYYAAAVFFSLSLISRRWELPARLRRSALLSIWALVVFVALWLATNFYSTMAQNSAPPWFSSVLFIPALMSAVAFAPLSRNEMGEIFRAVSELDRRVLAVYVFYRTGEPLVAAGASRSLPIEAEQLEGMIDVVGDFVETSMKRHRSYPVTSVHFDRMSILAIRGNYVIVAVVYDGSAYDALRSEIQRSIRFFEREHGAELETLEGATRFADAVADNLTALMNRSSPGRGAR